MRPHWPWCSGLGRRQRVPLPGVQHRQHVQMLLRRGRPHRRRRVERMDPRYQLTSERPLMLRRRAPEPVMPMILPHGRSRGPVRLAELPVSRDGRQCWYRQSLQHSSPVVLHGSMRKLPSENWRHGFGLGLRPGWRRWRLAWLGPQPSPQMPLAGLPPLPGLPAMRLGWPVGPTGWPHPRLVMPVRPLVGQTVCRLLRCIARWRQRPVVTGKRPGWLAAVLLRQPVGLVSRLVRLSVMPLEIARDSQPLLPRKPVERPVGLGWQPAERHAGAERLERRRR